MRRVFVLCVVAACGGDDPSCPVPADAAPIPEPGPLDPLCEGEACGGDPVGTWQVVASCARGSGDGSFFNCPEGEVHFGDDFEVRGTWVFGADGVVTTDVSERVSGRMFLPLSCYGLTACDQLEALAEAAVDGFEASCVDQGALDERCEVIPETCDCAVAIDDDEVALTMTYTVDPDAGTFTLIQGDETITGVYCATAEELWVQGTRFGGVDYRYRFERVPG